MVVKSWYFYFFILLLTTLKATQSMEAEQLKPCFERYDGHKLFDSTPFHSEWRMKSEQQCLPFCVKTSSRCASIVYDKINHICHYFTVNGIEFELLEKNPKMVYLQVAERRCIDDMASTMNAEEQAVSESTQLVSLPALPIIHDGNQQNKNVYSKYGIQPEQVVSKPENNSTQPASNQNIDSQPFDGTSNAPFEEIGMDKQPLEKYTTETPVGVDRDIVGIHPQEIDQEIEKIASQQQLFLSTSMPLLEDIDPDAAPAFLPVMNVFQASSRGKQTEHSDNEVRRYPAKQVVPSIEDKMVVLQPAEVKSNRARKNQKQQAIEKNLPKATILPSSVDVNIGKAVESEACQGDTNQIWMAVENSRVNSGMNDSMQNYLSRRAAEPRECMRMCKGGNIPERSQKCDSFTYFEKEKKCILDSVAERFTRNTFATADKIDFSTRAFHKFCYPANMSPFVDCSDFLAFRDYSLEMVPREIFDGLPTGRDGLSACLELCVLSNEFRCRSALFDFDIGTCTILDEHSLSNPVAFKEHHKSNLLYFENGCIEGELPQADYLGAAVERVKPSLQQQRPATIQPVRIDFKKVF